MDLHITKNKKVGDKKAFQIIKKQVLRKPDLLIGFAAGITTDNLYKLISENVRKAPKMWRKVRVFQIDETLDITPDSPLSFNHEIKRELKNLIKILPKKNIFLMDGTKEPKKTIKESYNFIKKNKGFDLIILGLGPTYDPHIAYNTSGRSPLTSRMRTVKLHPKTVRSLLKKQEKIKFQPIEKGITLGIKDILESKKALLIAYGKDKAKSLKLALINKVDTKKASASALQLHKNLIVVVDKKAAGFLHL